MPSRIRIGIDVGGTFTDAVAIDAGTLELVGQVKVPTTHHHAEGVARGIIDALTALLQETRATPEDVGFLAHGTTQATNALLEGDVAPVGVIGLGGGFDGWRARRLARGKAIELAPGKHLTSDYMHVRDATAGAAVDAAVRAVLDRGAKVVVAAEAFSVDDPAGEAAVVARATEHGAPATATHEMTKLYGLRTRVRTAVLNASILPRMLETAELVERSITAAGVRAPLMVMRCDGGVMDLAQMRRRPLLTMLSGPAAGVAGALMGEKVSEGVFLETGGTSTDISVIRRGRVAVRHAHVGGQRTFLNSLDVRTVGVGGGSLIRVSGGKVTDVGPRSAHIAGLRYGAYADADALASGTLTHIAPMDGDPDDYVVVETPSGERFAPTVSCAALVLGLVPEGDHAYASPEAARAVFTPLAAALGTTVESAAEQVLTVATKRVRAVLADMAKEYRLGRRYELIGGGGGAASVTPFLAGHMGLPHRIAANNAVISPIGVALAMVREQVERMIPDPSQADVLAVRREAEQAVVAQGARAETVEVDVRVDPRTNIVRAVASGTTELRTKDVGGGPISEEEARNRAAASLGTDASSLTLLGTTPHYRVYGARSRARGPLALLGRPRSRLRVVDAEGVVRLQSPDATVRTTTCGSARATLTAVLEEFTEYGDGGARLPALHLLLGGRIVNLAGMIRPDQVMGVAETELLGRDDAEPVAVIAEVRP